MSIAVIIPAAGTGSRFGDALPKQYHMLGGTPLIARTLSVFTTMPAVAVIIVGAHPDRVNRTRQLVDEYFPGRVVVEPGGEERQFTIERLLHAPQVNDCEFVMVHDASRPFVSANLIERLIEAATEFGAAIPGLQPVETIKQISRSGFVETTPDRALLAAVQTPQVFRREILMESYRIAAVDRLAVTDDASVVEYAGFPVKLIDGEVNNIKITTRKDWELAELILSRNPTELA